jgi:hypothetical protein
MLASSSLVLAEHPNIQNISGKDPEMVKPGVKRLLEQTVELTDENEPD